MALNNTNQGLNPGELAGNITNGVTTGVTSLVTGILTLVPALVTGLLPFPVQPPPPSSPTQPTTMRGLLLSLEGKQVQITTPFETLTGTLSAVQMDYVALVEEDRSLTLVRMDKIESAIELQGTSGERIRMNPTLALELATRANRRVEVASDDRLVEGTLVRVSGELLVVDQTPAYADDPTLFLSLPTVNYIRFPQAG